MTGPAQPRASLRTLSALASSFTVAAVLAGQSLAGTAAAVPPHPPASVAGATLAGTGLLASPVTTTLAIPPACDEAALPAPESVQVSPADAARLAHDASTLDLAPNTVANETTIEARSVCEPSLAPLDQGMTNVTKGPRRGYRFLPHMTFEGDLEVRLPYDRKLIPPGHTEQDVRTFYYDETAVRWRALERLAIDPDTQTVTSLTNHFTDMIAATVTVPDHPESLSYDPTTIKDIQSADPGAGINLIDPPQPSSHGDAQLTYPLAVPPGRAGQQPALGLSYSSGGGNGWLGVGWDLSMPSVSLDTRWGVPRYDPGFETETYMLNGQQLTPVAHRGELQPRAGEKVFHTRVESAFRRIVRHGDGPASYWWEVTEKDGTRAFYGGDPENGPVPEARIADDSGNGYRWALRQTRDLHGNAVSYAYETVTDPGVAGGLVPGRQLYLRTINYTRSGSAPGPYTVTFIRDSQLPGYTRRPDVIIDARGGFKEVTAELLSRVEVTFDGTLVRRYDLDYTEGAFHKSLLRSVTQHGSDGLEFATHRFSYHDDVRDGSGGYDGFAPASDWSTGADGVTAGLFDHGQASALSGTLNTGVGGHLYVGFNPTAPTKQGSAGGKVGFNHSSGTGVLAMVDLNGDGLPDKVFKRGDGIFFRLNTSGPDGSADFAGSAQPAPTLPGISAESSSTSSFGGEIYLVANVFLNRANTFTTNSTYFTDVNADGLTDLVVGGAVFFNHLDGDGIPTFTANSADTPVPIGTGTVDTNGIVADFEALRQEQIDNNPLQDTIRRWTAPFDGEVAVTGPVALVEDTSPARAQHATADGVRVAIQHNGTELWSTMIDGDDYTEKTPVGVDSIQVNRGDRLYFRVGSVFDGAFDQVAWDPQITYQNVTATTDVNNLDVYRYRASEDFVLAGRRGVNVTVPADGTVRLTGDLHKLGATTDDITLLVQHNGSTVFSETMAAAATGEIDVDLEIPVSEQDSILLRVAVDSPIDVSQLAWTPRLVYVEAPGIDPLVDLNGDPVIDIHPPYDVDIYPVNDLTAPQQAWSVPKDGTVTVAPALTAAGGSNGSVTFTVKRPGERVAKRTITISNGAPSDAGFELAVTAGDTLYFDFSTYDPELAAGISNESVTVTYPGEDPIVVPSAHHAAAFPGTFAQPYRGWAYAGYNGNRDRASAPIVEADLAQTFTEDSTFDPRTATAYPFNPFPAEAAWRATDEQGWVRAGTASSSRFGLDTIDVPRAEDFAGGRAVSRLSQTSQTAIGGGVSFLSGSGSAGTSTGQVDYLDLNGDRFPDIVSSGRVQYTTATGGLEATNREVDGLGTPRDSHANALNVGVGGSPAAVFGNGRGEVDTSAKGPPRGNTTGSQMTPLGLAFSGGLGNGDSTPQHDLLDVNGDGLPDRVSQDGERLLVALNLGYAFATPEPWGTAAINDGASENGSIGASLGYNAGIYDFAGGLSLTKNKSETDATLLDLNGDGLLDRVLPNGDGGLRVGFNTGNGFAAPVGWAGAMSGVCDDDTTVGLAGIDWDTTRTCAGSTGFGGGLYFTIGIGPLCWPTPLCYIIINPGADGSQTMSREEASLRDIDGDGYADHVASTDDSTLQVARNNTGRTNLLKSVSRPLGASFELDYRRDGNTVDAPHSRWVLARTTLTDGHLGDGADTQLTTYTYEGGVYDRLEREFYGYQTVTATQRDVDNGEAAYRTTVNDYRTDSYYTRGLLARTRTLDADGRIFSEIEQTYALRDVGTGSELADPTSLTATIFPQLVRTDERFYEGEATPGKQTFTLQHYDVLGNLDQTVDGGDTGAADDVVAMIDYSTCAQTYVVGEPTSILVLGGGGAGGTELRRREATVDCETGDITQVRAYLADGTAAVTDLEYLPDGNLLRVTQPPNANGQRYQLSYEYDPVTATHVTRVTNSFGLSSTASYDLRFGMVETETDVNGNQTSYVYDPVGRVSSVTGPYEQGGATPTIRFEYHPEAAVPWALTRHLDSFRSATDTIDTVRFIDGLKRELQIKQDTTIHTGPDSAPSDVMVVSGRVAFDLVGRTVARSYPVTEPLGTPGMFNHTTDPVQPTRLTFDVLDRNTSITLPDGTTTTTDYGFGADRSGTTQFEQLVTDANGHQKSTYRNARELLVGLKEQHTPAGGTAETIWTSYAYDPLQQLSEIRDNQHNLTTLAYDNLGRRTIVDNPDTGRTETTYDLDANLTTRVTDNLRASGGAISYQYDFNRLVAINYPDTPEIDVSYTYGEPGAPDNAAGRVTLVTDESGSEQRGYGRLGEIIREVKTVASETGDLPEVYTTEYTYDTFGRLQSLTYPDGEVLSYAYDSGGKVRAASGVKNGHDYRYLQRLEYDKFGQRAFIETGNNTRTSYRYDPLDRRLAGQTTGHSGGSLFQNLSYQYDGVGNLLELTNDVPVPPPSRDGGPTSQSFQYDDLDRLVAASGSYEFAPDKINRYSLALSYNSIHNLTAKQQVHEIVEPSGTVVPQLKTSYQYIYAYGGPQPHAPTHIGEQTYTYDANGNQTGWTHDQSGQRRTMVWDEENRLQSLFDNGHEKTYAYDDSGERVIKRGPQGETAYINQWFTIRNREIGTKHVFVGETRLVSKLMKQDKPGGNPNGNPPVEKDLYFFHSDHLASTNYVTDSTGRIFEHLEYFPSGETWVEESSNKQRTPYLFTGKELDEETGLYYFGARYYDPRTGVWQNPDPALERNLLELPEDASRSAASIDTSAPTFLNVYNYADANPLSKVDPDGRQAVPLDTHRLRAIARAQGIGAGLSGVQFNRAVGRAFQDFALRSVPVLENFRSFRSPARIAATGGRPASVIPDAVRSVTKVEPRWWWFPKITQIPNSSFFEVKAVAGTINLSHSNHQIRGLIDVAARSPAGIATGPHRPLPVLTFITTSDTVIGADVIAEATRRGVALYQSVAYEIPGGSGGSRIGLGPFVPLNPGVYGGRAVAGPAPGRPPGTLLPGGPANPVDPDPPEVQ